jgi:uncharacterized protein DUF4440
MNKILALLTIGMALSPHWEMQDDPVATCIQSCKAVRPDPEMQQAEITNLEREGAHALQMGDTAFFRRVYSEDFSGTLSHGQSVNKASWVDIVGRPSVKYESIVASGIRVRIYRDTAVATCLWSVRTIVANQSVGGQMRMTHVYVYGLQGWRLIASQATSLPPENHLPI